ncbi:MAG TPA: hypothetical protein VD862_03665 [Candidatus Paceibacterota bacterium]|nr:hypothetical protein [Candidatus Paceibacterota bacterium]
MSRKRKPTVRLVVVFDAGLPKLWPCAPGCKTNEHHLCKHRFPEGVKVVTHTKHLERPGLSDLHIIRHVFRMMGWRMSGVTDSTRWVIFTADGGFWKEARHHYRSLNGHAPRPPLTFVDKSGGNRGRVRADLDGRTAELDIYYLPYEKRRGTQRDMHLRKAAKLAGRLLTEIPV